MARTMMDRDQAAASWASVAHMLRAMAALTLALAMTLLVTSSASAEFSITNFTTSSTSSVAGAHPDLTTDLTFSTTSPGPSLALPDGNVRDLTVDLPAGLVGDTTALPRCAQVQFAAFACPAASQVGLADTTVLGFDGNVFALPLAVFLMEPRNDGETAEMAFAYPGFITVHMPISVRTDGDYGLTVSAGGIERPFAGLGGEKLTIWGVPADPSHDADRRSMLGVPAGSSQLARVPFLTNPSRCDGPLTFTASANSYQDQGTFSHASATLPQLTGCDGQPFDAKFSFSPTSSQAGVPSGYQSTLTVPQNTNADGVASANLRTAQIALPAGVTLSPGGAIGLGGCDDASLHIGSTAPAACPDDSRIGDATIDVPVLSKPIHGSIYLRQPLPGDLFRIVIVTDDFGIHLKIPGDLRPDRATGQLTARFDEAPQLPFSRLELDFDGGPHAPLSNPTACGTYTTHAELTPWSSTTAVSSDSSFTIDQGCGQENAFAPGFSAGMDDSAAAAHTSFHLRVTRDSGSALSTIDTTLPRGLLADISSVPRCPEAQAAAGTCGPESRIGSTTVGTGAGTSPLFVPQPGKAPTAVYLAGPYKDAPFSLSIVVPAQAGPFDLGTVVVRAGLYVDPVTAQATIKAEPLPTILEGVPLNLRDVRVDIDRPGFTFNPTNCDPQAVSGTLTSTAGQAVAVSSPFQVSDCEALDLSPKLSLSLTGKGQTTDGKHPALSARLTQPPGQSNMKKVKVTLPLSLALDPDNSTSGDLCEFAPGQKTIPDCPASSVVGTATAHTPILDQPLTGPVYFIKNVRTDPKSGRQIRTLPTLATVLKGDGVTLVVRASSSVVDDQLVTTFDNVPDAPVSDFQLNLNGGPKGILVVSHANVCKASQLADQVTDGQNGTTVEDQVTLSTPCALAVVASSHTKLSLKVTVGGLGAGKVSVSGKGLKKRTRTIVTATAASLSLPMSKRQRSALAHGRNVKVTVVVTFTPKGAKKAKKVTKHLVIHGVKR